MAGQRRIRSQSQDRDHELPLDRVASCRSELYHALSASLAYPGPDRLHALRRSARNLRAARSAVVVRFPYASGVDRFLSCLATIHEAACPALQREYVRLFSPRVGDVPLSPYESTYLTPPGGSPAEHISGVEREYAAAGIIVAPGTGESPDHVALELAFLGALCGWEAEAWRTRNVRGAIGALRAQQRFLTRHLCRWLPLLTLAAHESAPGSLFQVALDAADALTAHDASFIGPLVDAIAGDGHDETSNLRCEEAT